MRRYLEFLKNAFQSASVWWWALAGLSTIVSLVITLIGETPGVVRTHWYAWLIVALILLFFGVTEGAFRAWLARETVHDIQLEELRGQIRQQRESLFPGLEIVFVGTQKPYFEEQRTSYNPDGKNRRFRVGIRNSTHEVIRDVELVLEDCKPNQPEGVHLGHAMQVMGKSSGTQKFDVNPGISPTVFVDVISEDFLYGLPRDEWFCLCYAANVSNMIPRMEYFLTLQIQGGGMTVKKSFLIREDRSTKELVMNGLEPVV